MSEPDPLTGCCHHHRRTLTSWRECWDHEAAEEYAERVAAIRRQCCDHREGPARETDG